MRLSECKENMFSFAEREHSRSAIMLQRYKTFSNGCNITTFFNTIHSFFVRKSQKIHKNDLLSERNEDKNTIKRYKNGIAIKKREIESSV